MGNKFLRLFLLGFFVVVAAFVSMGFVSAAITVNTPAAAANITGTYTFNATEAVGNVGNVTFYWFSNGWVQLCQNTTANATVYTCSYNTGNGTITEGVAVINATAISTAATTTANVTVVVDNTVPTITVIGYVNGTLKLPNTNLTINISVADINITRGTVCIVNVNGTNQTLSVTPNADTVGTCNTTTLSLKGIAEGNQTINIYAGRNHTYWSANLTGVNATQAVFVDGTGPQVDLTLASSTKESLTLNIGLTDTYSATSSCTVDRSGATVSGITSVSESGLGCATSYTYVVTCTDVAGNTGSVTETFSTLTCGAAAAASGGGSKPATHSFSEVTPGAASIVKYSDPTLAVKQIEITVTNPAQNVQVSVTKYASKPAEVSVAKTGKVYQYVQIDAKNVGDKLDKANVQFKVEKSWASTNAVSKDKISVYKFDSSSGKWNEQTTTYSSEDATYYYYDVSLDSFSYFAVSERSLVAGEGTTATGEEVEKKGGGLTWLWVLIAVVVLVVIWLVMRKRQ